jgi:hypothetical protein
MLQVQQLAMADKKTTGDFDYYEIRGVIVPGAIVVAAAGILWADLKAIGGGTDFSLGELGIFVVLSFVAGHLVAAFGNLFEAAWWWLRRGWPSEWIGAPKGDRLLDPAQHEALAERLKEDQKIDDVRQLTPGAWKGVNRRMYARVSMTDGATQLVDVFNSNYGLFRGMTTSLVLVAIAIAIAKRASGWPWTLAAVLLAFVTAFRMDRFGQLYSKELVARYLVAK